MLRGRPGCPVTATYRSNVTMKSTSSPAPYSPAGRSTAMDSIVGGLSEMPIDFEADKDVLDPLAGRIISALLPNASTTSKLLHRTASIVG